MGVGVGGKRGHQYNCVTALTAIETKVPSLAGNSERVIHFGYIAKKCGCILYIVV